MREKLTVEDLFGSAGFSPCGPVTWGEPCPERQKGVYVVVIDSEIVYVGRTRGPLAQRIREFYRHISDLEHFLNSLFCLSDEFVIDGSGVKLHERNTPFASDGASA